METTTATTFTTRTEAARMLAEARGIPAASAMVALECEPVNFAGMQTFEDNGAGMVKITTVSHSITRAEWSRKPKDYRTGDPRKGTAKVLHLTDRGTCLVPVTVV